MMSQLQQTLINYKLLIITLIFIIQLVNSTSKSPPLQVIYAINAGGDEHIDENGIRYEADPLHGKIGTDSDYGKSILMINRAPQTDEILYQTERYHTATFGYDIKLAGDGEYVLVLKFCEVYFNGPNMKVFDVVLNHDHTVVNDLDIYQNVGKGTAHDEYIYFTISRNRLYYKEEESEIRGGKTRIEFIKGVKDNPKINAFALLKGDVEQLPKLPPLINEDGQPFPSSIETQQEFKIPTENFLEKTVITEPNTDSDELVNHNPNNNNNNNAKMRKTSGPKQPNPYSMDDSSVMLPVFIAIGAFIPLLFCLCKL